MSHHRQKDMYIPGIRPAEMRGVATSFTHKHTAGVRMTRDVVYI